MIISAVQFQSGEDIEKNVDQAVSLIEEAAAAKADLVVLPEFFNTIFFAQYWDRKYFALAEAETGYSMRRVKKAAADNRVNVIATLYEMVDSGLYYDTAFVLDRNGETVGRYRKVHPAAVNSLEKIYFRPGDGFHVWDIEGWKVGICICYDAMFPESARMLMAKGAELIAVPYATNRTRMWFEMLRSRAFENGAYLLAANKAGLEGEWEFSGNSVIIDPLGDIIVSANGQQRAAISAEIKHDAVRDARIRYPVMRDRRPDRYADLARDKEIVIGARAESL